MGWDEKKHKDIRNLVNNSIIDDFGCLQTDRIE